MDTLLMTGVIRNGRVEVAEPICLPDGSEVTIISPALGDSDRSMTEAEIAATLAAMAKVEPFDWTDDERAAADDWERKVNEHGIADVHRFRLDAAIAKKLR